LIEEDMNPPSSWDPKKMTEIDFFFAQPGKTPEEHAERLVKIFVKFRKFLFKRPWVGLRFALPLLDAFLAIDLKYSPSKEVMDVVNDLKKLSSEPEYAEMPGFTHSSEYKDFGNTNRVVSMLAFIVALHYYKDPDIETFKIMRKDLADSQHEEEDVKMSPKIQLAQILFAKYAERKQRETAIIKIQACWRGKQQREKFKKQQGKSFSFSII
jgi:hypothetical protein